MSWSTINKLTREMFTVNNGGIQSRRVHFYGNDGVCLFKYFVTQDDPQRSFSWSILAINFTCFVFISLSYLGISIFSVRSSRRMKGNEQINERNLRMQRKISLIIATDFCCWIPFVIICTLHSLSVLDATRWYSLFSIVILPINSVANPLLYDNKLTECIKQPVQTVARFSSTRLTTRLTTFSFSASTRGSDTVQEQTAVEQ